MTPQPTRSLYEIPLRPFAGSMFKPTGFPDVGAAKFRRPLGGGNYQNCLLVESAQSMANRLEGMGWDDGSDSPVEVLAVLPYVRVTADGDERYLTSSRQEAHRLSSGFVKDSTLEGEPMRTVIRKRLGLNDDTPLAPRAIAAAVFALDPMCLLHGVFFNEPAKVWPGQPKISRAITGFIEAGDIEEVVNGGVKRDSVRHSTNETAGSAEGYGSIPFHRIDYTAASITAFFSVDHAQIASYGLGEAATRLLNAVALWEIRMLLDSGMRLRTDCDFVLINADVRADNGEPLPDAEKLSERITSAIADCRDQLGIGGPIDVKWSPKKANA